MSKRLRVKYPLFLSDFNETNFLDRFLKKKAQISNSIKIRPVEAELFDAHRRTGRHDKADSRFSQFCDRTKKFCVLST